MGLKKLFDSGYREMKRCDKLATKIEALDEEMQKLTDEELKAKTPYFMDLVKNGKKLDDILVEAYAVAREAAYRVTGMKAYHVQLVGAAAIHGGNIAEMKTGEGKTLTAVFPAYLNALSGDGVHIVTVNEYLAGREAHGEIGDIYRFLGLTVGLNLREYDRKTKREQYMCDIMYSTNSELGFDYLRDNMVNSFDEVTQIRGLNYAIIDEVDSILIDDARTPLIISGPTKDDNGLYEKADTFVKALNEDDYSIDIESRSIALTPSGVTKAEKFFKVENIYDVEHTLLVHRINNALKAVYIFSDGKEYVVQDGAVLIVDASTGRILKGRQFSEGLHQAIEAKEEVEIKKETITVATITYQNFFRMYKKLSGMTGTAKTEEEEFRNIYNMYVVEVPTNLPVIRIDDPDLMFLTTKAKFEAIAADIKERYQKGQPVLVGTISIETSELLSDLLKRKGVPHNVLNAKQHEREAEIVANAGQQKAVTIATNMAGRGTDIKLGEGVVELGGLCVIGTERHESRRIDNQLRGRSGRQGDPGYTRFYLSAEDELLRRFGSESFKSMLSMIVLQKGQDSEVPLESKMFSKFVENAQKRIEGNNFDNRKTVLEYDEVLRKQREIIYEQRASILFLDDISEIIIKMMTNTGYRSVYSCLSTDAKNTLDVDRFIKFIDGVYFPLNYVTKEDFVGLKPDDAIDKFVEKCKEILESRKDLFPEEVYKEFLKVILLRVVDTYWTDHIDAMSELRQAVRLQAYAQINPLREYQEVGFDKFETMIQNIESDATKFINRAQIKDNLQREAVVKPVATFSGKEESMTKRRQAVSNKVGRNEPCPCGSGKKYKNCCGK